MKVKINGKDYSIIFNTLFSIIYIILIILMFLCTNTQSDQAYLAAGILAGWCIKDTIKASYLIIKNWVRKLLYL